MPLEKNTPNIFNRSAAKNIRSRFSFVTGILFFLVQIGYNNAELSDFV